MRYRSAVAVIAMVVAVALLVVVFPWQGHALAVTGIVMMIAGAVVAAIGIAIDRHDPSGLTSRRR
ncbi:hypothetical protein [Actinoplanes sp. TFC3]|uniref:hypothetical protein n=1 Tax=Actinoplanes sp. TFC3 TaxID=1710355 RepID=UPI00128FE7BF|nr:hypothetical protein [Actinoplanes sp. TFC3]